MDSYSRDNAKLSTIIAFNVFAFILSAVGFIIAGYEMFKIGWDFYKFFNMIGNPSSSSTYFRLIIAHLTCFSISGVIVLILAIVILASNFENQWCRNNHAIWGVLSIVLIAFGALFIFVFACSGKKQIMHESTTSNTDFGYQKNGSCPINNIDLHRISQLNILNKFVIVFAIISFFCIIAYITLSCLYRVYDFRYRPWPDFEDTEQQKTFTIYKPLLIIMLVITVINSFVYLSLLCSGIKILATKFDNEYANENKKKIGIGVIVICLIAIMYPCAEWLILINKNDPSNSNLILRLISYLLLVLSWVLIIVGIGFLNNFYRNSRREILRGYGHNYKSIEEISYISAKRLIGGAIFSFIPILLTIFLSSLSESDMILIGCGSTAPMSLITLLPCVCVAMTHSWQNENAKKYKKIFAVPAFGISLIMFVYAALPFFTIEKSPWLIIVSGLLLIISCILLIIYCCKVKKELFDYYGKKQQNNYYPKQNLGYTNNSFRNPYQQPVNNYPNNPYNNSNTYNNPYNYNNGSYNNQNQYNNINNTNSYNNAQNSHYGSQNGWAPSNGYNNNNNH